MLRVGHPEPRNNTVIPGSCHVKTLRDSPSAGDEHLSDLSFFQMFDREEEIWSDNPRGYEPFFPSAFPIKESYFLFLQDLQIASSLVFQEFLTAFYILPDVEDRFVTSSTLGIEEDPVLNRHGLFRFRPGGRTRRLGVSPDGIGGHIRREDERASGSRQVLIRLLVVPPVTLATRLLQRLFTDCHMALLMTSLVVPVRKPQTLEISRK